MQKVMHVFIMVLLMANFVLADSWNDINDGVANVSNEGVTPDSNIDESVLGNGSDKAGVLGNGSDKAGKVYTNEFYIALGVLCIGLVILILFIYLFFRAPQNKFDRR